MTETTKAVLPSVIASVLPLFGLGAAVFVNAAWIGLLVYWIFRLVQASPRSSTITATCSNSPCLGDCI